MQYSESDLTFIFPPPWQVVAFDKHRFYQYVNGHGLRGVDFIGVHPEFGCFLMEVKNYRLRFGDHLPDKVLQYLDNPALLVQVLKGKFEDSLRLLHAVQLFLERKWWFRFACKYAWYRKLFVSKENKFWIAFFKSFNELPIHLWACMDSGEQRQGDFERAWETSGLKEELKRFFPEEEIHLFSSYNHIFQESYFFRVKA
jgi:hypothetical protein